MRTPDMRPSASATTDDRVTALAARTLYLESVIASLRRELAQAQAREKDR